MAKKVREFGIRDKIGYTMGDFGCNMSFQLVSSYAMIYFTQGMGLSLKDWAIIVVLAKVFDAINDPIIGAMVDRRKPSKNGKFRPWIFFGSFSILITTVLFFVDIRSFSYAGRFAYTLVMYCLWSIAYTAANVPYGSLNAALTNDISGRAQLSSLRNIGAGLAIAPIMILMPKIIFGEENPATGISPIIPERFVWTALAMGFVGWLGFMLLYSLTTERILVSQAKTEYSFKESLIAFFKNRAAIGISLASFAQMAFFGSVMQTVNYVFQVYFKNTDMIIIGNVAMFVPMIAFVPFISSLTRKYGKKEIATYPLLGGILILFIMLLVKFQANTMGGWLFLLFMGLANLTVGIFMLVTWSFVADVVDYQELITNRREEGTVYSIYSFIRKLAQAVSQGLVALLLAAVGFDSQNVVVTSSQTANGVLKITIILPLLGVIIMFLAMHFIYNLDKEKTIEIAQTLKEKHATSEGEN